MNLPPRLMAEVNPLSSFRDGALAPDLRCAIAHQGISRFSDVQWHIVVRSLCSRPGMTGMGSVRSRPLRNPLDEQIEDRLGGALGLGAGDAPARKMAVDVHPGKAIDQG